MREILPFLNLALTTLVLVLGWVWTSGRWTSKQEIDGRQLVEDLKKLEAAFNTRVAGLEHRLEQAGQKMSDLGDDLQVFTELGYRVKALEDACEDLPSLREEVVTMRTVLRLRKRNGGGK